MSNHRSNQWLTVLVAGGLLGVAGAAVAAMLPARPVTQEDHALAVVKEIGRAETLYRTRYPDGGYACVLAVLGSNYHVGAPGAPNAQILPDSIANGENDGYKFEIIDCRRQTTNGRSVAIGFRIIAVPVDRPGKHDKGFCMDETNAITADPKGGSNCTEKIQ